MILQPARIIAAHPDHYLVETLPKSACPRCAEGKGCGGGILAQAFANKTYQISVPQQADNQHHVNELVQVALQSQALLVAALVMYLLPLLTLIAGAFLLGISFNFSDFYTVSGAVIGFALGALLARKLSRTLIESGQSRPFILEQPSDSCFYQAES